MLCQLFSKRPCTEFVDPATLSSFVACQLIALDKMWVLDLLLLVKLFYTWLLKQLFQLFAMIQSAAGSLQLRICMCWAVISCCEAAAHLINSLNWQASLYNIQCFYHMILINIRLEMQILYFGVYCTTIDNIYLQTCIYIIYDLAHMQSK